MKEQSTAPGTLSGRVLDSSGRPAAQAQVFWVVTPQPMPDIAALTAADGSFVLAAPHVGRYEVGCGTESQGAATATLWVGAAGAWVDLHLDG